MTHAAAPSPYTSAMSDSPSHAAPSVIERVQKVLALIRPAIQADGGDVELVEVTAEGVARIRLLGACIGCPSASVTLHVGIERNLRHHVPEIKRVEAVPHP
ncbi:MAG: Fe/S biosis protein NfuA [Planctomycetota bacterium]